jgi:hypothetical protein
MSSSENRKRTVNLKVRCLPEEEAIIRDKAAKENMSISEFLRYCALGGEVKSKSYKSKITSQLINDLRRLGGLQKHLFNEGKGAHSKEYTEILQAIKEAILRIED